MAVWLPRRAGRQSCLWECSVGRVSQVRAMGPWEIQSSANSWTGEGFEAQGIAALNFTKEGQKCMWFG